MKKQASVSGAAYSYASETTTNNISGESCENFSRHIKASVCAFICIYTDILLGRIRFTLLLSAIFI